MIKNILNFIFSRQFCTKLMIGVMGWYLRTLTVKDTNAITNCLHLTYDLKNLLEEMKKKNFEYSRSLSYDEKKIFEFKKLLEKIERKKVGLMFPCHLLNQLTSQTLNIIKNKNESEKNYTISEILEIWGYNHEKDELAQVTKILEFLSARFPKRLLLWCISWLKFLKNGIIN